MCGFAGEFRRNPSFRCDLHLAEDMAGALSHRGPDEAASFLCPTGACAIAFRRLAIIDPHRSHQPMSTPDGRFTIAYNGEIYNFRSLRQFLTGKGVSFRTDGDTEVVLHLYAQMGPQALNHLEGMFALVIYDAHARELFLARDRLGQKPLWYCNIPGGVAFASEAKGLLRHSDTSDHVSHANLTFYLALGYVPAPRSIWSGIHKLPPGSWLTVRDEPSEPVRYWQPVQADTASDNDWPHIVRERVTAAVRSHMVSDVPIGSLLSGGIDSNIITAIMCHHAGTAGGVKTFTAGFADPLYDERRPASESARLFGTDHTELLIDVKPADAISAVTNAFAEPFGDSSALPTLLISAAASEHVKVVLTGDGGDEVFGGYDRYRAMHLASNMSTPAFLAVRLAAGLASLVSPKHEKSRLRRLIRFADALPHPFAQQYFMHRSLFSAEDLHFLLAEDFAAQLDLEAPCRWFTDLYEDADIEDEFARAQYHDLMVYLPDDLLVKTDLASMASSIEFRAPFLDRCVVESGFSMPTHLKTRRSRGKAILREAFGDILPPHVLSGPKRGFGVPLARWLQTDLRLQLQEILLDKSFLNLGIFRPQAIHGLVNDHLNGIDDHSHRLWSLLILASSHILA